MTPAPSRKALIAASREAARGAIQEAIRPYAPDVPEAHGPDTLLAWLTAAVVLTPQIISLDDLTRAAWRARIPPAALANRFRSAGLAPPSRCHDAVRLAVLCHAVALGLAVEEFAGGDARPWYRLARTVAQPYYDSARIVLETARRLNPSWATERWLLPLLVDIPADAWVRPYMLTLRAGRD